MADVVERIKSLRYVHVPQASQLFEEAVAEIERLRANNDKLRGIIRIQDAAIRSDTATLTDAEREALAWAARFAHSQRDSRDNAADYAAILRGLLERTE